jgi:hypothetical protein
MVYGLKIRVAHRFRVCGSSSSCRVFALIVVSRPIVRACDLRPSHWCCGTSSGWWRGGVVVCPGCCCSLLCVSV